jgi:hypothetical protein
LQSCEFGTSKQNARVARLCDARDALLQSSAFDVVFIQAYGEGGK